MVKGDPNDIYIFQRRSRGKANSWQLLLLRSAANVFSVCLLYCEIHRSEKHRFLRPLLEVTSVEWGKIFRDNDVSGMQVCRHPVCFILLTVLWRAAGARFRKERARLPPLISQSSIKCRYISMCKRLLSLHEYKFF